MSLVMPSRIDTSNNVWDTKSRCMLLEFIGQYPPLGINKSFSIINCTAMLNLHMPDKNFTVDSVTKEVEEHFNLDLVDDFLIDSEQTEDFELPQDYRQMMNDRLESCKKE
eukprot:gene9138-10717_t